MKEDQVFTDLDKFPKSIQKFRFEQLQKIAFSKGITWVDTDTNYERTMAIPYIFIQFKGNMRNGKTQYMMYSGRAKEIEYRELIKRLREL